MKSTILLSLLAAGVSHASEESDVSSHRQLNGEMTKNIFLNSIANDKKMNSFRDLSEIIEAEIVANTCEDSDSACNMKVKETIERENVGISKYIHLLEEEDDAKRNEMLLDKIKGLSRKNRLNINPNEFEFDSSLGLGEIFPVSSQLNNDHTRKLTNETTNTTNTPTAAPVAAPTAAPVAAPVAPTAPSDYEVIATALYVAMVKSLAIIIKAPIQLGIAIAGVGITMIDNFGANLVWERSLDDPLLGDILGSLESVKESFESYTAIAEGMSRRKLRSDIDFSNEEKWKSATLFGIIGVLDGEGESHSSVQYASVAYGKMFHGL